METPKSGQPRRVFLAVLDVVGAGLLGAVFGIIFGIMEIWG